MRLVIPIPAFSDIYSLPIYLSCLQCIIPALALTRVKFWTSKVYLCQQLESGQKSTSWDETVLVLRKGLSNCPTLLVVPLYHPSIIR